jgi:hypothetical protein
MPGESTFSDHVVYVDESGDHGLDSMDASYAMFVLALCLFRKDEYVHQVVPALQKIEVQAPRARSRRSSRARDAEARGQV